MAQVINLYMDQGASFGNTIQVVSLFGGGILDLSDHTAKAQMRKSYGSKTAFTFTTVITSPTLGKINISMTPEETQAIKPGRYLYDIEVTSATTGVKIRVIEGVIVVSPEITQI